MKKVFLSFFCSLFVLAAMVMSAQGAEKISICHIPPDNPTNLQTISVGLTSLPTHLAHCDTIGACTGDACTSDGGLCGCNSACCSGNCSGGMCAPACKSNGESCNPPSTSSSECCSSICSEGMCAPACKSNGESCSPPSLSSSECCGGICSGEGICASQCTYDPDTGDPADDCSFDVPCCPETTGVIGGGVCIYGACYRAEIGEPPLMCAHLGEACDDFNGPQCCFDYSCGDNVCCKSIGKLCSSGAECCNGNCSGGMCCKSNGDRCSSSSECCGGICSGEGICAADCTYGAEPMDEPCTFDLPCCPFDGVKGGVCIGISCYAPPYQCVLPGVPCTSSDICCFENSCGESSGVCEFTP